MTIDLKTVAKVAQLSRLKMSDADQEKMTKDLGGILDWIAQLNEVDTEGVEPLSNVHDMAMRRREDIVNDGGKAAEILANAPAKTADFFTVPKVVE